MGNDTIKVSTDALDSIARNLSQAATKVSDASSTLAGISVSGSNGANRGTNNSCSLTIRGSGISGSSVGSALREYRNALSWYSDYVSQLSGRVQKVKSLLEECDSSVRNTFSDEGEKAFEWNELAIKIFGKAGYAGSLFSSALSLRDFNAGNIIRFSASAAFTSAKWYKSNKNLNIVARSSTRFADGIRNKRLFGLNKYSNWTSKAASKRTAFKANFSYKFLESARKPGAWAAAAIGSGIDNYQEYKTGAISADRAGVEWAAETVGSFALGAAAPAAVGAVMAGIAPSALVVGAVAVGAVVLVDAVWARTLGKKIGQANKDEGIVETAGWCVGELYDMSKEGLRRVSGADEAPIANVKSDFTLTTIGIGTLKTSGF